jgi:DNA polymerase-3 subunit epsilon
VRSSSLDRKLVAGVLVLFLVPTLFVGLVMFLLYQRGVFENNVSTLLVTGAIGLGIMAIYLGSAAYVMGRSLVGTLHQIRLGTELMATVNPEHRLEVQTGDELEALATEINRMADHVGDARTRLESEVSGATEELEIERGKLSAVLEALGEGVLLVNPHGLVSLANRAAQELLGQGLLGRSLFDYFDREKVAHFLERLRSGASTAERFTLQLAGGTVLETVMTRFLNAEGQIVGFILVLRDVTLPTRSDQKRHRRLADTLQELRNPLSSIRSLSESLLADASLTSKPARRLLEAVHDEAVRLSGVVSDLGEPDGFDIARPSGRLEQIAVADLTFMALRRLSRDDPTTRNVMIDGQLPSLTRLAAEATTFSGALAHLLRSVLVHREPARTAWLRPMLRGRVLEIDVGVPGTGDVGKLEMLLDTPAVALGSGGARRPGRLSAREVVHQHAGEVWAYAGDGRLGFKLMLPILEPADADGTDETTVAREDRFVGAGLASGFAAAGDEADRPEFYDFSLFDAADRHLTPAERDRSLEDVSFVVLDLETTGLEPEAGDRIVSLAGVKIRAGSVKRAETFDALVNPGRKIPSSSIRFHGITDTMVAEAPPIEDVLPAFLSFADGCVLVGHEVSFDLRFLSYAAERLGLPGPTGEHPVLDTLLLSEVLHGPLGAHRLEDVARRLGIAVRGRHSALGDALTTAEIFVRLIGLLKNRGIQSLGQAVDASGRVRGRLARLAAELSE